MQHFDGTISSKTDSSTLWQHMSDQQLSRMMIDFCQQRLPEALTEHEIELMQRYLALLVRRRQLPPYVGHRPNWPRMAEESGVEVARLRDASRQLKHGLEALIREIPKLPPPEPQLCRPPKPLGRGERTRERNSADALAPIPRTTRSRARRGSAKSNGLLPVSRTQSLGVMMDPEVDYGTQGIQPRVQA